MAVSDKSGQLPLYTPTVSTHFASLEPRGESASGRPSVGERAGSGTRTTPAPRTTLVDVTTLDAFFRGDRKPPHFLKIDVEGHELSVLEGGRRTLEAHHPTILVECESRHRPDGNIRTVFNLLKSLDYTAAFSAIAAAIRSPI